MDVLVERLKQRHREEKHDLLERFKEKANDFEELLDQQVQTIERLRADNSNLLAGMRAAESRAESREAGDEELHRLRQEIVDLRQQQKHLESTIRESEEKAVQAVAKLVCLLHFTYFDFFVDHDICLD